jgi:hypothetical protein
VVGGYLSVALCCVRLMSSDELVGIHLGFGGIHATGGFEP